MRISLLWCSAALLACTPIDVGGDASSTACRRGQKKCGTGCIPSTAVCCDEGSTSGSSYCANAAGGGCQPNNGRGCRAGFPSGDAKYCCASSGTFGSNDCPDGQTHCGLLCQPTSAACSDSVAVDENALPPGACWSRSGVASTYRMYVGAVVLTQAPKTMHAWGFCEPVKPNARSITFVISRDGVHDSLQVTAPRASGTYSCSDMSLLDPNGDHLVQVIYSRNVNGAGGLTHYADPEESPNGATCSVTLYAAPTWNGDITNPDNQAFMYATFTAHARQITDNSFVDLAGGLVLETVERGR